MNWSIVRCQYEGAGYSPTVEILVETDDIDEAYNLIRNNKDKIEPFTEHSVQEECMYPIDHPSFDYKIHTKNDVEELLSDIFAPDFAIFKDETIMNMKYYGNVVTI